MLRKRENVINHENFTKLSIYVFEVLPTDRQIKQVTYWMLIVK